MAHSRLLGAAILVLMVLALPHLRVAPTVAASTPTFSADVAPILFSHCASCHRPGEIAPMSLLTYETTRPWARAIRDQVATGQMPPWHATQPRGTFANDRRLSDQDRNTLIRWVDAGAPRGNPKDLPPPPRFTEGWQIGEPDVILRMPEPFEVPASGEVDYQNFRVPTNFSEDKWVQAIEVRPGARKVVHHILVFCAEPDGVTGEMPFAQVVPKMHLMHHGKRVERLIATTAPGTNAMILPPGEALLIKAGATLRFQIHYTADGTAAADR
ncbi:MAG TPA: thiol-disulfide isomerase, partial [Blastocatellia bacterium]|nr:thiol-disulfide isomerase [Blastocatellia bacterium]